MVTDMIGLRTRITMLNVANMTIEIETEIEMGVEKGKTKEIADTKVAEIGRENGLCRREERGPHPCHRVTTKNRNKERLHLLLILHLLLMTTVETPLILAVAGRHHHMIREMIQEKSQVPCMIEITMIVADTAEEKKDDLNTVVVVGIEEKLHIQYHRKQMEIIERRR